jgi:hypothetical protein
LGAVIIMSLFSNDKNAAKTASGDQQREAFARLFRMNVVTCCTLILTGLLYYKYGDKEVEEEGNGSNSIASNGIGGINAGRLSAGGARGIGSHSTDNRNNFSAASAGSGVGGGGENYNSHLTPSEIELEGATDMRFSSSGRQERWRRIGPSGPEPIGKRNYAEGVE